MTASQDANSERWFSFRKSLLFLVLCTVSFILIYQYRVVVKLSPEKFLDFKSFSGLQQMLYQAPAADPTPLQIQLISNVSGNLNPKSSTAKTVTTAKPKVKVTSVKPPGNPKDTKPAESKPKEVKQATTVAPKPGTTSPKPQKCKSPFTEEYQQKTNFLCCRPIGRMGNTMFVYASAYGIAAKLNRTLVFPKSVQLINFLNLSAKTVDDFQCVTRGTKGRGANIDCGFDKRLFEIPKGENYCVGSYMQSYMYFDHVKEDIRKEFTFHQKYRDKAKGIIDAAVEKYKTQTKQTDKPVIVGVHIRRGDLVNHSFGYDVATPQYMHNASSYFRQKYGRVLFLVCSNGMDWTKKNMKGDDVVYIEGNDAITDMAVLVSCDHTLSTVGSFSWWAGYLTGGDVLYYQWPARNGTRLRKHFRYEEYFPKHWIGMR